MNLRCDQADDEDRDAITHRQFVDRNPHVRRVSLIFPAGTPRRFQAVNSRTDGFATYLVLIHVVY